MCFPALQVERLLRELERERSRADVAETRTLEMARRLQEITGQYHEVRVRTRLRFCRSAVRWL